MGPTKRGAVLGALCLAASCAAETGSGAADPSRLIGEGEARVVERFGPPDRRRTDAGETVLFYDRDRLSAMLRGRTPAIEGGRKGMDASLACYATLRLSGGSVAAVGEAGAC